MVPDREAVPLSDSEKRAFWRIVLDNADREAAAQLSRSMSYVRGPQGRHVRDEFTRRARMMWREFFASG